MKVTKSIFTLLVLVLFQSFSTQAQVDNSEAIESITAAELRNHIFFLASDFLKGRVATSPEYEIAAQYVGTQFAAAGLEPGIKNEDGSLTYYQGVPFVKTVYNDKLEWELKVNGTEKTLIHKEDFKIIRGSQLDYENLPLVWAGYGISEPDYKWDDLADLDLEGKIAVLLAGAPMKKGNPVLPAEIHEKYASARGYQLKIYGELRSKGAAGVILVDLDGSTEIDFNELQSSFSKERVALQANENSNRNRRRSFPSTYMVKPEFLQTILGTGKNNPLDNPDNILKNYKPQNLDGIILNAKVEILTEDVFPSNNVVGIVPGTDPVLKNEYIVVGAHLDHVRPRNGEICNGADDNASGSSGVMEIAEAVAMNPGKRSVVFITYTAEEMGLIGSRYFIGSDAFPKDQIKFNINMDMIGRTSPKNEESRAHYVVTNQRYLDQISSFITEMNQGITDFPFIFDNDQNSPGGSDHQSFIGVDIPAFFFFSGLHPDLHQPGDDAEKIDYAKAESICRLGYLMTQKLANMETVPSFLNE